jgi:hypothetical protein
MAFWKPIKPVDQSLYAEGGSNICLGLGSLDPRQIPAWLNPSFIKLLVTNPFLPLTKSFTVPNILLWKHKIIHYGGLQFRNEIS